MERSEKPIWQQIEDNVPEYKTITLPLSNNDIKIPLYSFKWLYTTIKFVEKYKDHGKVLADIQMQIRTMFSFDQNEQNLRKELACTKRFKFSTAYKKYQKSFAFVFGLIHDAIYWNRKFHYDPPGTRYWGFQVTIDLIHSHVPEIFCNFSQVFEGFNMEHIVLHSQP